MSQKLATEQIEIKRGKKKKEKKKKKIRNRCQNEKRGVMQRIKISHGVTSFLNLKKKKKKGKEKREWKNNKRKL